MVERQRAMLASLRFVPRWLPAYRGYQTRKWDWEGGEDCREKDGVGEAGIIELVRLLVVAAGEGVVVRGLGGVA